MDLVGSHLERAWPGATLPRALIGFYSAVLLMGGFAAAIG